MIKDRKPINIAEAKEYVKDNPDLMGFIKNFAKLAPEKAKELRTKLEKLDLMKVRDKQINKIIELLPENEEDLNKIFTEVNLDEDETKKILDTIKEYK